MPPSPSSPLSPAASPQPTASTLPLPLSASILLTTLPHDASTALLTATSNIDRDVRKIKIRLHPISSAPPLTQKTFKISATQRFETVVGFLRKRLGVERGEGVFCYVNSVFAPGLDERVGGLWDCFKQGNQGDEQLVVGYSMTPAFG